MMKKKCNVFILLLFTLFLVACNKGAPSEKDIIKDYNYSNFTKATLMESSETNIKVYSLKDGKREYIDEIEDIMDFKYSENILIYLKEKNKNKELPSTNISIIKKDKKIQSLDKYNSYIDLRISKNGNNIAYRAFEEDSLSSAKGVMVYNMATNKESEVSSDILISGNVYDWIDENNIVYYGAMNNSKESAIFLKDTNNNEEKKLLQINDGFIVYLESLDENNIITMKYSKDNYELVLINLKEETYNPFDLKLSKVFYSLKSGEDIYVMGKDESEKDYIYKLQLDRTFKKAVFNFPKNINSSGGMAVDENGNVYFLGYEVNKEKSKVYMIKKEDNSVNLIIDKEKNYHIYQKDK